MEENDIIILKPIFKHTVWGGSQIQKTFGYDVKGDDIGECWGIASHPNGDVQVAEGKYKGKYLSELWNDYRELFGNANGDRFPLMVKIIDAGADLSIQVHPDNVYASMHERGAFGKNECWYILSAEKGARLIIGHNAATKDELNEMIDQGRFRELVREIPVQSGDFVQIDAGTVHAIKGGIMLLETQQSSDVTYRLYDYDRIWNGAKRELHIEKCKDVIAVPAPDAEKAVLHETLQRTEGIQADDRLLVRCPWYEVHRLRINGRYSSDVGNEYLLMTVVEGEGKIDGCRLRKGMFFIVPAGYGKFTLQGSLKIIWSKVF